MILLALWACNHPCRPGPEPTLVVGQGADTFAPLDTPVPLVSGSQGGYHLDLAVRTTELDGRNLSAGTLEARLDDEIVADGSPWFQLTCADDVQEATGLRLILDDALWDDPSRLVGAMLDVTVSITDARATTLEESTTLVVGAIP
jgi:hypothetical protein